MSDLLKEVESLIQTKQALERKNIELVMAEQALLRDIGQYKKQIEELEKDRNLAANINADVRKLLVDTPDYQTLKSLPSLVKNLVYRFESQRETIQQQSDAVKTLRSLVEGWKGYVPNMSLESNIKRLVEAVNGRRNDSCCEVTNDAHNDEVNHLNQVIDGLKNKLKDMRHTMEAMDHNRSEMQSKLGAIARLVPGDEKDLPTAVSKLTDENAKLKKALEQLLQGYEKAMDLHNSLYPSRPEHAELVKQLEDAVSIAGWGNDSRILSALKNALKWIK